LRPWPRRLHFFCGHNNPPAEKPTFKASQPFARIEGPPTISRPDPLPFPNRSHLCPKPALAPIIPLSLSLSPLTFPVHCNCGDGVSIVLPRWSRFLFRYFINDWTLADCRLWHSPRSRRSNVVPLSFCYYASSFVGEDLSSGKVSLEVNET
jgi:hypothetical protein